MSEKKRGRPPMNYKGVRKVGRKYLAEILVDGEMILLGTYTSGRQAANVYDAELYRRTGSWAYLNNSRGYSETDSDFLRDMGFE